MFVREKFVDGFAYLYLFENATLGGTRRATHSGRQSASSRLPDGPTSRGTRAGRTMRCERILPCPSDGAAQTMTKVKKPG